LNSPAVMEAQWDHTLQGPPAGFTVTLTPNGLQDLPFYPLRDYRLAWELSDRAGKLLASGEQQLADLTGVRIVSGNVGSQPDAKILKLQLTLLRPGGAIAAESSLDWDSNAGTKQPNGTVKSRDPGAR
jgi:hypothetical protein